MAFDFFNNSNLAFGAKLTKVFTVLDRLAEDAENNVDQIASTQALFEQYLHKNYIVPKPISADSPCRTNELFDVLNSKKIIINDLRYDNGVKEVKFNGVRFDSSNNRLTTLDGSSTLRQGFIRFKESVSNSNPEGKVLFAKDENDKDYTTICQYRVDSRNTLNIIGSTSAIKLNPYDFSQYISMSKGTTLASNSERYVSDDYQAVCVIGTNYKLIVKLNGEKVIGNTQDLRFNRRHTILYLKPKDVITGTYSSIFKINYNY